MAPHHVCPRGGPQDLLLRKCGLAAEQYWGGGGGGGLLVILGACGRVIRATPHAWQMRAERAMQPFSQERFICSISLTLHFCLQCI